MTPLELLEETIAYYSADPLRRASDRNGCYYNNNGKYCAVGRCLKPEENTEGRFLNSFFVMGESLVEALSDVKKESLFLPQYKGIPKEVWGDIQLLHDNPCFWNNNGLTNFGEERANKLRVKYSSPPFI